MPKGSIISPSLLSADFTHLADQIHEAEAAGAGWFHIDVMDGHFVPNLTMGPFIVEACRRSTKLPLDVHLMIETPEALFESFAEAGADWLTVHIEACPHIHKSLEAIRALGMRAGVALNPGTPAGAISEVLHQVDLILIMTVDPGYSGGKYIPEMLDKIRTVRSWREAGRTKARIAVDGGISAQTAPAVAQAGADVFVAASAVFKHPQGIRAGIHDLRAALQPAPA
jgi:ribulose-phosphate 3-epimerase